MPPLRWLLVDRLNWRSNTGSEVAIGPLIITSWVLPAGRKTSPCTRDTPGSGFPSSATRLNPAVGAAVVPGATTAGVVSAPTIEGTCMRSPAFTKRTSTDPLAVAGDAPYRERPGFDASNDVPLIRK